MENLAHGRTSLPGQCESEEDFHSVGAAFFASNPTSGPV